jgi:hypothetical protein
MTRNQSIVERERQAKLSQRIDEITWRRLFRLLVLLMDV